MTTHEKTHVVSSACALQESGYKQDDNPGALVEPSSTFQSQVQFGVRELARAGVTMLRANH
jgi:hypothetical protein